MPTFDFTNTLSAIANASRRFSLGNSATLQLLDHASAGERGYVAFATVADGWNLADGGIGQPMILVVNESSGVDEIALRRAAGCGFAVNGAVYKITENNISAPLGESQRGWIFQVEPTGETI